MKTDKQTKTRRKKNEYNNNNYKYVAAKATQNEPKKNSCTFYDKAE